MLLENVDDVNDAVVPTPPTSRPSPKLVLAAMPLTVNAAVSEAIVMPSSIRAVAGRVGAREAHAPGDILDVHAARRVAGDAVRRAPLSLNSTA